MNNYAHYLSAAIQSAKEAGELVRTAFNKDKKLEYKSAADVVTETDKKTEELIVKSLQKQFPDHLFLGEESAAIGIVKEELLDSPTWIIDPIDGTTNFVHRYPCVAISIAFAIKKEVVVGVVYNPILDELFYATKGGGAFLNGNTIRTSSTVNLHESLVATGFRYDRSDDVLTKDLTHILHVLKKCRNICTDNSAALDMCGVAMGRFDIYYEYGIHAWDIAAGLLIVREAGGIVVDPDLYPDSDLYPDPNLYPDPGPDPGKGTREIDICARRVLAGGNKELAKKFLFLLRQK